jgi:hypothetical protein
MGHNQAQLGERSGAEHNLLAWWRMGWTLPRLNSVRGQYILLLTHAAQGMLSSCCDLLKLVRQRQQQQYRPTSCSVSAAAHHPIMFCSPCCQGWIHHVWVMATAFALPCGVV